MKLKIFHARCKQKRVEVNKIIPKQIDFRSVDSGTGKIAGQ